MTCLAAPAALGVLTTAFGKKFPKNWHVDWLNKMIYGGVAVLGIDHIANGEIIPWFPFLTAMSSPNGTEIILGEILSVGVPTTIALVLLWIVIVVCYEIALVRKLVMEVS
jgi:hypothetical protein